MDQREKSFAKGLSLVVLDAMAIGGIQDAWGEHRFVAAFAESVVAQFLYLAGPLGALIGGVVVAEKLRKRWKRFPGWALFVVGLAVFIIIAASVRILGHLMPGVGWRIERMLEAEPDGEWDGRGYQRW